MMLLRLPVAARAKLTPADFRYRRKRNFDAQGVSAAVTAPALLGHAARAGRRAGAREMMTPHDR